MNTKLNIIIWLASFSLLISMGNTLYNIRIIKQLNKTTCNLNYIHKDLIKINKDIKSINTNATLNVHYRFNYRYY